MLTANVMIDLETLGIASDAKIISIGAVVFDVEKDLGDTFYIELDWNCGGQIEANTVKFWMQQASKGNLPPMGNTVLSMALSKFIDYLKTVSENKELIVWANGSDFDIPKLYHVFSLCNYAPPWKYNNVRDYRTVSKLFSEYGLKPEKIGHHNALADAKWQAIHLISILKNLKETVNVAT